MVSSCRNMWRQRSFWARGWPAILQTCTQREHKHVWLLSACLFGFLKMSAQMQIDHWENRKKGRQRASTDLLINCSRPRRRSSMKDSSKRPSSGRNGSCLFRALPGRAGTTIWESVVETSMVKIKHDPRGSCCTHLYQHVLKLESNQTNQPPLLLTLTLLSLSSSLFNHSKSLYLLFTHESFNLKMGRFVCIQEINK